MPQKERLRVWRGELKKTSGGLTKSDLTKNKRGKIVSKKKSAASSKENNLGKWLRVKGESFGAKLQEHGLPSVAKKGQAKPKPKPKGKPPKAPKPSADPKPKKPGPKLKPKPQKKVPKAAPKKKPKSPVKAGQLKNLGKISVGNIVVKKQKKVPKGWPTWTRAVLGKTQVEESIRDQVELYEDDGEPVDWNEIKQEVMKEFAWTRKLLK